MNSNVVPHERGVHHSRVHVSHNPLATNLKPLSAFACLSIALLVGCTDRNADTGPPGGASSVNTISAFLTDEWLGQWNGPEGTFLRLAGGNGKYEITIQNLDGPRIYQGSTAGDLIQFERNGVKESIRSTDGTETGMKWLGDKKNCLTVRTGEGYCRD